MCLDWIMNPELHVARIPRAIPSVMIPDSDAESIFMQQLTRDFFAGTGGDGDCFWNIGRIQQTRLKFRR